MIPRILTIGFIALVVSAAAGARAETSPTNTTSVEQTTNATIGQPNAPVFVSRKKPLPEEYIWTTPDQSETGSSQTIGPGRGMGIEHHYFRRTFMVNVPPAEATLYIAGPRSVSVWLNGVLIDKVESDTTSPLGIHVFATKLTGPLRAGSNTLAIEAVRGKGVSEPTTDASIRQLRSGCILAAKILPAAEGLGEAEGAPLLISDTNWKSSKILEKGWETAGFNDSAWPAASSLGGIESNPGYFAGNADTGMYNWPDYEGIAAHLRHASIGAIANLNTYLGRSRIVHPKVVTPSLNPSVKDRFEVKQLNVVMRDADAPSILLDFGVEVTGRLRFTSAGESAAIVTVQMGDTPSEASASPPLGINQLIVPAQKISFGPVSVFRYAKIRFVGGGTQALFKSIDVDAMVR